MISCLQTIRFETLSGDSKEPYWKGIHLDNSPSSRIDIYCLKDGDVKVIEEEKITITFDYPFRIKSDKVLTHTDGWTLEQLASAIAWEYQTMYDEEEDSQGGLYGIPTDMPLHKLKLISAIKHGRSSPWTLELESV